MRRLTLFSRRRRSSQIKNTKRGLLTFQPLDLYRNIRKKDVEYEPGSTHTYSTKKSLCLKKTLHIVHRIRHRMFSF